MIFLLPVSDELKEKLKKMNQSLKKEFPLSSLDRQKIRQRLTQIGEFRTLQKWEDQQFKKWLNGKTLVGVDGSVNSIQGNEMRTLSVFQALAKGLRAGEEKWSADVYTPLLDKKEQMEAGQAAREARERRALLSELELKVA